jgi:hypothetical protein
MKITKPIGVNKDGYASGGVDISIPDQNLIKDPRAKSSIRGSNQRIPTGDTVEVRGTKRMRPDKKPVKATWY